MFTLKLYRRNNQQLVTKIMAVDRIQTMHIGANTDEVWAFKSASNDYEQFYVGKREDHMTVICDDNHWEWGLLENGDGKTTQHIRPYSYG